MDDSKRHSGLPRPSRLPARSSGLPKPTSSIPRPGSVASVGSTTARASDGRSSAASGPAATSKPRLGASSNVNPTYGDTRTSRLRNSASREQLAAHNALSSSKKPTTQQSPTTPRTSRLTSGSVRRKSSMLSLVSPEERDERSALSNADQVDAVEGPVPPRTGGRNPDGRGPAVESVPGDHHKPRTLRSRPSLSERTMKTLARVPSSPALRRRSSAFFEQKDMSPTRSVSGISRPDSQQGPASEFDYDDDNDTHVAPVSTPAAKFRSTLSTINGSSRRVSGVTASSRTLGGVENESPAAFNPPTPSSEKKPYGALTPKSAAKPAASPATAKRARPKPPRRKASPPSAEVASQSAETGWDGAIAPVASKVVTKVVAEDPEPGSQSRKSSSALREQIARAKAAKRSAMKQNPGESLPKNEISIVPADDGFDFGVDHGDPFNLNRGVDADQKVLQQRLAAARGSGRLNIAALRLKEIPEEVMKMYDLENIGGHNGSWAESVDLTRFIAADNELESLSDDIFPDKDPNSYSMDDEGPGNIFGGLETLDLHGNLLTNVPIGFRRLQLVTSLNLSSNQLSSACLELIAQMPALRDLKLANNKMSGPLHPDLVHLDKLEILDIHGNNISELPPKIEEMSRLRILNLSENSFKSIDFTGLSRLPLTELVLSKNKLSGTLINEPIESLPELQTLDVSLNQLNYLVPLGSGISFPILHTLSLSMNRLQGLPDMTSWESLLTLTVDENSISSIPNSFTSLAKLRHADFSSNDIRVVPPEIARMDSLSMLRLSGNPLRDKKFMTITTFELKDLLASRLEPPPPYQEPTGQDTITDLMSHMANMQVKPGGHPRGPTNVAGQDNDDDNNMSDTDDFATPPTSAPQSPSRSRSRAESNKTWPVKQGGVLDRSNTASSSLLPAACSLVARENQVRTVYLHHNLFEQIPTSLSFFETTLSILSLSFNQLAGDSYLPEQIELPALKELNLSNNRITSLEPLETRLQAPLLEKLDLSVNRLSGLPETLKSHFPSLSILFVSSNQISNLEPEAIRGLKMVDASSNDIGQLNPKIGLLGGAGGLEKLEVSGNRFKVPRWDVLQKGSQATLRWLRDRVPADEMAQWRRENGEDSGGE